VRIRVSESLGRKVRHVSAKTRLPEQVIASEAITRGYALLKS
jgi:predicted transcriptional regulator